MTAEPCDYYFKFKRQFPKPISHSGSNIIFSLSLTHSFSLSFLSPSLLSDFLFVSPSPSSYMHVHMCTLSDTPPHMHRYTLYTLLMLMVHLCSLVFLEAGSNFVVLTGSWVTIPQPPSILEMQPCLTKNSSCNFNFNFST